MTAGAPFLPLGTDRNPGRLNRLRLVTGGRDGHSMNRDGWAQAIEDHRAWMAAAAMSPNTIYLRCYQLRRLSKAYPAGPWTITTDDLVGWLGAHGWSAGSIRSWRSMIGSFYRWAVITGRIPASPAAALPPAPRVHLHARPAPELVFEEAIAIDPDLCGGRPGGAARGREVGGVTNSAAADQDWGIASAS